jgi:hypothetical protein
MPEELFVSLLRQRAVGPARQSFAPERLTELADA